LDGNANDEEGKSAEDLGATLRPPATFSSAYLNAD